MCHMPNSMCVCMHVCRISVRAYACMHVRAHACMYIYMYVEVRCWIRGEERDLAPVDGKISGHDQEARIGGHNYIGHNYIGHNYIGHNYIGHVMRGERRGFARRGGLRLPTGGADTG